MQQVIIVYFNNFVNTIDIPLFTPYTKEKTRLN